MNFLSAYKAWIKNTKPINNQKLKGPTQQSTQELLNEMYPDEKETIIDGEVYE